MRRRIENICGGIGRRVPCFDGDTAVVKQCCNGVVGAVAAVVGAGAGVAGRAAVAAGAGAGLAGGVAAVAGRGETAAGVGVVV